MNTQTQLRNNLKKLVVVGHLNMCTFSHSQTNRIMCVVSLHTNLHSSFSSKGVAWEKALLAFTEVRIAYLQAGWGQRLTLCPQ